MDEFLKITKDTFSIQVKTLEGSPKVLCQRQGSDFWIHFNGKTFRLPFSSQINSQASTAGKSDEESEASQVFAPIDGSVWKILCQKKQKVKRGETLVILESMKMEYTLTSPRDGEVEEIFCNVEDKIQKGKILVELKEKEKEKQK